MAAGGIRMGGVFVEIGADAAKFFSTLNKVNSQIGKIGKSMVSIGTRMAGVGVGLAAPIAAAVKQGAQFESVLLDVKASTGATTAELESIRNAAMGMSQALGVGPTEAAQGMLNLLKAGVPLEQVLAGAGEAALQFAKVANMDGAMAAEVMSKAMNAFGVDAATAANAMSAGADASATSVLEMAQAFSQASAVASTSNQSITDLSAALAVLANKGIVGSDAGTSIKTMLQKLKVPTDASISALEQIGLTFDSFRGADGKLLPLVSIINVLNKAIAGVDEQTKDNVFGKLFGSDAIRAASILSSVGVEGFTRMKDGMAGAMSVGDKFSTMMSGLSGVGASLLAALERLAIAISDAVGPAMASIGPLIVGAVNGLTNFVSQNKEAVVLFAQVAVALIGVGSAIVGVGYSLQVLSGAFGVVLKSLGMLGVIANPIVLIGAAIVGVGAAAYKFRDQIASAFSSVGGYVSQAAGAISEAFGPAIADAQAVFSDLYATASTTLAGIYEAIAVGDLSKAMDILWAGLQAGWLRGVEALMSYVDPFVSTLQDTFTIVGAEIYKVWDSTWVAVGNSFNTVGAYLAGVMDNVINGLLASWDTLEAGIRKAWVSIQSVFGNGQQKQAELEAIDAEMSARADARNASRPGVNGRVETASEQNQAASKALNERTAAVDAATADTMAGRERVNAERAASRREETMTAQQRLAALTADISKATTVPQDAAAGASVADAAAVAPAEIPPPPDTTSQAKVAGTFSSLNLGATFGGTSAAERTAKATEEIAKNTRDMRSDTVAA